MNALLGIDKKGRTFLIEQAATLAIIKDNWKYIKPNDGPAYYALTDTESGNALTPQLYNLADDKGEKNNLAGKYPDKVRELEALLQQEEDKSR
jgi:arylsulfatase A-like enzyme